ncbi:Hypothetical predicted protein [Marmota monax]|uniref:Uncharacterized protein n=1 Tax=Marmota monax TaxID=9995 RepID=A0A5E4CG62_MARMO|nr:Hypothetical predicted protein [Marmota monax]
MDQAFALGLPRDVLKTWSSAPSPSKAKDSRLSYPTSCPSPPPSLGLGPACTGGASFLSSVPASVPVTYSPLCITHSLRCPSPILKAVLYKGPGSPLHVLGSLPTLRKWPPVYTSTPPRLQRMGRCLSC